MPKRKEQEALFFKDVDKFRSGLIEKGGRLAAVIAPDYPNAERVCEEIRDVLHTVETYEVVRKWVTFVTSRSDEEFVTTREICSVSIWSYSF